MRLQLGLWAITAITFTAGLAIEASTHQEQTSIWKWTWQNRWALESSGH